jgi:hypothetical protein
MFISPYILFLNSFNQPSKNHINKMWRSLLRRLTTVQPVNLDYADLLSSKDLSSAINEAFGPSGLGLLTVSSVPDYAVKRSRLLPLARSLAQLPAEAKSALEAPEHNYSVGWSHGKEHFMGAPDFSKGSFYANPEVDKPFVEREWPDNLWPRQHLPELEPAFKALGKHTSTTS